MKNLSISAGQPGRLVFNLSASLEGTTPVGYVAVTEYPGARPVATAMQWVAADHALYLPPMPFGCFFYEVRVGALEVAKGHIDVAPTPFPYDEQEFKTWVVSDGDIVNDVATFNIDAAPGLQGPPGAKGESGHVQSVLAGLPVVLAAGGVHDLGELGAYVDLSELRFEESTNTVQTAELWFSMGASAYAVTWPEGVVWAGEEPTFTANTAYRFALRREPSGKFIINLAYEYSL